MGNVEIRCFGLLKKYADEKGWAFPYHYELERDCTAIELAGKVGIPTKDIEGVFINGIAKSIDTEELIKPGNRVGFIPYGVPGPYRVMLGYRSIDKNKQG